jgi:hypothetical protein
MQLQRTRIIDLVENASETSSDKRPGSATLRRSYYPLKPHNRVSPVVIAIVIN